MTLFVLLIVLLFMFAFAFVFVFVSATQRIFMYMEGNRTQFAYLC